MWAKDSQGEPGVGNCPPLPPKKTVSDHGVIITSLNEITTATCQMFLDCNFLSKIRYTSICCTVWIVRYGCSSCCFIDSLYFGVTIIFVDLIRLKFCVVRTL